MADAKLLPGFEDDGPKVNLSVGDADDIVQLGPAIRTRDDLTPEERAQNEAHDEALARARKEASEIPDDD